MKNIVGLLVGILFIMFFLSCRHSLKNQTQANSVAKVEVLYFHTGLRCPACIAIENNTIKVLDENYKALLNSGIIKFSSYDIDDKVNRSLVEKYQILPIPHFKMLIQNLKNSWSC
jgi:hypothetical protein